MRCKYIALLTREYDKLAINEFGEDYLQLLEQFENISEAKLRKLLRPFYSSGRSADQAWRNCKGKLYEYAVFKAVKFMIEKDEKLAKNIEVIKSDILSDNYKDQFVIKNWSEIYPDADIIVINRRTREVLAIISCKTSLRERFTETAFWKHELMKNQQTKNIRVLFVTTDKDNELRIDTNRYILQHIIDCTFITDPINYARLIDNFRRKYGHRKDFKELLNKVRRISDIIRYFEENFKQTF